MAGRFEAMWKYAKRVPLLLWIVAGLTVVLLATIEVDELRRGSYGWAATILALNALMGWLGWTSGKS